MGELLRGQNAAINLLLSLLLGALLGLLYDALRPLRRTCGVLIAALLDVLFCAVSFCAVFLFSMFAENGLLGLWELTASLLGFTAYMHLLSPFFFRLFSAALEGIIKIGGVFSTGLKKTAEFLKKLFQKMQNCIIIKRKQERS